MSNLFDDFPKLLADIEKVSEEIGKQITTDEVSFNNHIKRYFNNNAKLLRPAFVLIAASYKKNYKNNEHIKCAAAAEMLHVASLIHDDIIDNAHTRRGVRTLNSEFDSGYALICGDYLYAKSFEILFNNISISAIRKVGNGVVDMAVGEAYQYLEKYNNLIDVDKYLDIIAKKSASLFQSNLITGAKLANLNEHEESLLIDFGFEFGLMFQVQDDILDLKHFEMFKPINSDVKRGVYTLPIIIAANNSVEFMEYIKENSIDFDVVNKYLDETNAIELSMEVVNKHYKNCCDIINSLSNKQVQEYLLHITNLIYRRVR